MGISGDALTTWESCLKAGRYTDYVNSVEEASFQDGVRGTPTVRINGEEIELAAIQTPDLLKQATQAQALAANPTPLIGAALLYLVLLLPLVRLVGHFEGRHRAATQ